MIKLITKLTAGTAFTMLSLLSTAQSFSPYIVVDQFGYLPEANKVAVIRDPQTGYDASDAFTPSSNYALINATTSAAVFTASPVQWKSGTTDVSSGDKAWWFDFTSYATPGKYYVKDVTQNVRSAEFVIADTVYKNVLKAAMRMLYYQRSSFAKAAPYAGTGWTDAASHTGALQDKNARLYNNLTSAATEKDLHGGWYDAGDLNKYTPWTANYVITLLTAYQENPTVFTDDFNIPESGNGVPDILDEVKWGIDHLLRMQQSDGSCLSVLGSASGTPPSAATGQSKYGPATTQATLKCAEAFALASKIYKQANPTLYTAYAATLQTQAIAAWTWANANTNVQFNNSTSSPTVAAGNQETDDLGRKTSKLGAALYLYDLTGQATYLTYFESNYTDMPLVAWSSAISQYFLESQSLLMYYLSLPGINTTIANNIRTKTVTAINKSGDFANALTNQSDPYRSFIKDYNWGSNQYKSNYGNLFWELNAHTVDNASNNDLYLKASEEYLHYIHGVNPLQLVYLTNMATYGAEQSANEMYHTWFADGSTLWDRVGTSTYGPPPGFLMGGANNNYAWDNCCNSNCGSTSNTALCTSMSLTPPKGQPQQKSYKDFNSGWPLNSWQITETSLGYQTAYIRLLSKYVKNTSITTGVLSSQSTPSLNVKPNPTQDQLSIDFPASVSVSDEIQVDVYNVVGNVVLSKKIQNSSTISIGALENGVYILKVSQGGLVFTQRVVKIQ
ncbi:glycoside hydrolase family 9 protein [Cytophaga aurantiaca]|uniref:glycoside hydrolase family 9 protein n=1 Tax=Cytophaga aurantiaca TaxID=29530 RepID=UPI0003816E2F|nr:glycoside hydrolase family 9 protein [Cytophaga aurantiaca]